MIVLSLLTFACSPATVSEPPPSPTLPVALESTPTASGQLPRTEADIPRVSVEEAVAAIKNGEAVVLDVRSAQAYQAGHIPGALSIPQAEIEANPSGLNLDKDKWIITYCT